MLIGVILAIAIGVIILAWIVSYNSLVKHRNWSKNHGPKLMYSSRDVLI